MSYGVTAAGFSRKGLPAIQTDLIAALENIFGDINTNDDAVFGQLIGVFSKIAADWWEQLENVYYSFVPSSASGSSLDGICEINAITRLSAVQTTVVCQVDGTPATSIPAGSQVRSTAGDLFTLDTTVVLTGSPDDANFTAIEYGPIPALAGTITEIVTPISGWDTVDNTDAGVVGRYEETDAELRQRRIAFISIIGAATVEAIGGRILQEIDGVTAVSIYTNREDTTDIYGRPPHSVEAVVLGGDDDDIRAKLWETVAAGIQTYGNESGTITDSNGDTQDVYFSRPVTEYVWIIVTVDSYYNEEIFPVDGSDAIKEALVEYGSTFGMGKDLIIDRWQVPIYTEVPGIGGMTIQHAVTSTPLGTPSYGTSNIAIGPTSIAEMDTDRITVNLP
jgi:uncharacterized phage protein gp47/JayE